MRSDDIAPIWRCSIRLQARALTRRACSKNVPAMTLIDQLQLAWTKVSLGRRIRRHGWSGVYIGDYEAPPSWAYTQGFDETLDHPELVVFDLPRPSATRLFWQVFQQVKAGVLVIEDGLTWPPGQERP